MQRKDTVIDKWEIFEERDEGKLVTGVKLTLPCQHESVIRINWVDMGGRFIDRLGCSTMGCRKIFENVVLKDFNWGADEDHG